MACSLSYVLALKEQLDADADLQSGLFLAHEAHDACGYCLLYLRSMLELDCLQAPCVSIMK